MTIAVLGFGGNIGNTQGLLAAALARLSEHPQIKIEAVSPLYETPPWGKTDQPAFLNAAARIATSLTPRALLDTILAVERLFGRERTERWGPRTVDIDILLFGSDEIDEPGLHVPHPRLHERAFALAPLVDVCPNAEVNGRSAVVWLERTDRGGMRVAAKSGWHALEAD